MECGCPHTPPLPHVGRYVSLRAAGRHRAEADLVLRMGSGAQPWSGAGLDQALGTLDRPQRLGEASSLLPPTKATVGHPLPSSPESGEPSKRTTPDQACLNAGKASRLSEACSPAKRRRWPDLPSEAGRLG